MTPDQQAAFEAMFEEVVAGKPHVLRRGGEPVAVLIPYQLWCDFAELIGADPLPADEGSWSGEGIE